jgi:dCMP deaminase
MSVIAYVPAYHRGYAEFFAKHPGPIYLIGEKLAKKLYPQIERDFRAVPAKDMAKVLRGLGHDVHVLYEFSLKNYDFSNVVMPNEDISQFFALKYLVGQDITFDPMFLRWDGWSSVKETPIPKDRTVSHNVLDLTLLGKAKAEAQDSPDWWRQIGALIARDGKPLLIGHNRPGITEDYKLGAYGDPRSNFDAGVSYQLTTAEHAEAHLIAVAAGEGTVLKGCDMYVTTFPCPTCAKSIVSAGIKRVFYAEGYSLVDAEQTLRDSGVHIILVKKI